MPIIPWIIAALAAIASAILAVLWRRRIALLSEELRQLRHTLRSWEAQPATPLAPSRSDREIQDRLEALRESTCALARQISSRTDLTEPEDCVAFFREAITTLSRTNRRSREQLTALREELAAARARLQELERRMEETEDDPSTIDSQLQDVRALLAVTLSERDQLRYRIRELTDNMRKP